MADQLEFEEERRTKGSRFVGLRKPIDFFSGYRMFFCADKVRYDHLHSKSKAFWESDLMMATDDLRHTYPLFWRLCEKSNSINILAFSLFMSKGNLIFIKKAT